MTRTERCLTERCLAEGYWTEGYWTVGPEHDCNVALQSLLHLKVEGRIQGEARSEKCLDTRGTEGFTSRGNNWRRQVYARLWCVVVSLSELNSTLMSP